jgi:flagellar biosynthetic protein FliP
VVYLPVVVVLALAGGAAHAQPVVGSKLPLTLGLDAARQPQDVVLALRIVLGLAALSLAPALIMMVTSFTRIIIVLGFLRGALGTQQTPPNSVLAGLAMFLTIFVMHPVWTEIDQKAIQPYSAGQITYTEAVTRGAVPLRAFLLKQTREKDLALFIELGKLPRPATRDEVPFRALVPAFLISELKSAFQLGFVLYVPFLIIDLVVASALLSMGMLMLPPVMISLPVKLLLFVMVDGWHLVVRSLVLSFW